ncbi:uncharacterized protein LOC130974674 [Arachis stenosperma]|uniref:uncharacterized protein LOC130974674 n=1 Tax=Arachis stenosperma TaxID=217475 RepID=UPI0025AC0456|nr:uncharacterized protein LOC130974674 [Arachis stenosperma]
MNTGLVGKKEISTLTYRMPVAVASSFAYQKMHIKSDQQVSMMFSYQSSIGSIYSMELCVKLQDVGGSSSSSNNMEELWNFDSDEAIPFSEIGRARTAHGLADSSDEGEIEDDSGDEAEIVPETQPVQEETFSPTWVEPINVMGVGDFSSSTPGQYLQLRLGPMNSTTAEDIPNNYALTSEMVLEIGLKFLNKKTAMLVVKNYNICRSAEFKVVESDHTRYVCRCKFFGEQCR